MKYGKLIRDKIPSFIPKHKRVKTHKASENEFITKLHEKLLEEAKEFIENPSKEEMADIKEVLDALCTVYGFDKEEIKSIQRKKAEQKGAFKRRLILDSID